MAVWNKLKEYAHVMNNPEKSLKNLLISQDRLKNFSQKGGSIFYDYSRQRVDEKAMELLFELSIERKIQDQFNDMMSGKKINNTEKRAVLHTACRSFSDEPIYVDGKDIMPDIAKVREATQKFTNKVHMGEIRAANGKPFTDVVVIGIGGSYLGAEFVKYALAFFADKNIKLHFLSNVDINNFGEIVREIKTETTLWIIISKSYTTAETTANEKQAYAFMKEKGIDPARHVITVTSKGSPGDDPSNPVIAAFHMFDFIGGRYSVTSAVGGVPLSLYIGYDKFERFLKGAEEMDIHTRKAPVQNNLPMISALISIWNNNFLKYSAQGIIPYAQPLSKLAPHIQQLYMESNGKYVTKKGEKVFEDTGVIIFGEPGTNAQHSFFQLAHQGRAFPIDFIGVIKPQYNQYNNKSKGVTNHQELWANLIAQPMALAIGKEDKDMAKYFPGNRPSSTILLEDLSPENIGRLLSFYEAKTVYEAFIWDINPFDQFGVELGKKLAENLRKEMAAKNENLNHEFTNVDPISKFYLDKLTEGKI
ncbi:MAG: glucose-6-phosphate isomerase [Desulfobacterales bacterium]|nr:glucose-6-phosphate isomerase [Desulfobacterales bacterium]